MSFISTLFCATSMVICIRQPMPGAEHGHVQPGRQPGRVGVHLREQEETHRHQHTADEREDLVPAGVGGDPPGDHRGDEHRAEHRQEQQPGVGRGRALHRLLVQRQEERRRRTSRSR